MASQFSQEFHNSAEIRVVGKQITAPDADSSFYRDLDPDGIAHRKSGTVGNIAYGGWTEYEEFDPLLQPYAKYNTYYNMSKRTPVLAACIRTYLENVASSRFDLIASKHDTDGSVREFYQEMFFRDCRTRFRKIVQHASTAKLYGFWIGTWNWRQRSDGKLTLDEIRHLPQHTITEYRPDDTEKPNYIVQNQYWSHTPGDQQVITPYWKCIHIVEDILRNTREGDGLLRDVIEECYNYHALKAIQKFGFERSLRGVLKFRAPREILEKKLRTELKHKYSDPEKLADAIKQRIDEVDLRYEKIFAEGVRQNKLTNHIRLDSSVLVHRDDKGGDRPVATPKFDAEFMDTKSDPQAHDFIRQEIDATEFRIAQVFGLEGAQLGKGGSSGTYNLSVDKTDNFRIRLESALDMIAAALYNGVIVPFGQANGIPEEKLPTFSTEIIRPKDPERSTKILVEFEKAGFDKADPAYRQIRVDEGLPPPTAEQEKHFKELQTRKFEAELEMPEAQLKEAKMKGEQPNSKERGEPPNQNRPYQTRDGNKR